MKSLKGIFAFIIINLGILITISLIFFILGLFGIHIGTQENLLLYSFIVGFASSIISLFSSIFIVKKLYNIQMVGEDINMDIDPKVSYLYDKLNKLNRKYGYNIELGIYTSDEPNAFATGCGLCGYLIAFSTAIIDEMTIEELDGVLGHEFAHIDNKDVIVTSILQGFLNTFVIYLAHIVSDAITDKDDSVINGIITFILEIVLGIFVSIILAAYSRYREYSADYDSATKFSEATNMLYALQRLKVISDYLDYNELDKNNNLTSTMKINNFGETLMGLFSTHPKLNDRIERVLKLIK